MPATPRDSSSVILVRADAAGAVQALLIRRHQDLAFAGGTWVFPGGKLEPADASPEATQRLGLAEVAPAHARFLVAACRETFEETGVVLASAPGHAFCDPQLAHELQPFRAEISQDAAAFPALLAERGLALDPARFLFWAHWITPSMVPRRFNTRFFVTMMPPDQIVRCDSAEATELLWLDLRAGSGMPEESLIQAPPTRFSLADLAFCLRKHGSPERLMQLEAGRRVVPIMPKMLRTDGKIEVLLPWDPGYSGAPGECTPSADLLPQYRTFPSRVQPPTFITGMPPAAG
jgi:8-oxo-dGTP pyrophosphatase MutT (NUDIX family)